MKTLAYFLAVFCLSVLVLVGCGGSSTATPVATAGTISTTINWEARSRAVTVDGSALSLRITYRNAANEVVATRTLNRTTDILAYTAEVVSPTLPAGTYSIFVEVFGQPDQAGVAIGGANLSIVVPAGVQVTTPNVAVATTITSVTFTPPSELISGESATQLTFTAWVGENVAIVPTGAATWAVTSGENFASISAGGLLTPIAAGTAVATVTISGVSSAPTNVVVSPGASVAWMSLSSTGFTSRAAGSLTISLTRPAPAGGYQVEIDEQHPDLAICFTDAPFGGNQTPTVTVPPGQSQVTIPVVGKVTTLAANGLSTATNSLPTYLKTTNQPVEVRAEYSFYDRFIESITMEGSRYQSIQYDNQPLSVAANMYPLGDFFFDPSGLREVRLWISSTAGGPALTSGPLKIRGDGDAFTYDYRNAYTVAGVNSSNFSLVANTVSTYYTGFFNAQYLDGPVASYEFILSPPITPSLVDMTPNRGLFGTQVTLNGTHLLGSSVFFQIGSAPPIPAILSQVAQDGQLIFSVPSEVAGFDTYQVFARNNATMQESNRLSFTVAP